MAVIGNDTFTGTNGTALTAHTPDSGAGWTVRAGEAVPGTYDGAIRSNRAYGNIAAADGALLTKGDTPGSASYDITADVFRASTAQWQIGLVARYVDSNNYYYVRYLGVTGYMYWEIRKVVGGVGSSLGTYAATIGNGTTVSIKFEVRNAWKKLFVAGVERISTSDNEITQAGLAGIFFYNVGATAPATTGLQLDNYSVNTVEEGNTYVETGSLPALADSITNEEVLYRTFVETGSLGAFGSLAGTDAAGTPPPLDVYRATEYEQVTAGGTNGVSLSEGQAQTSQLLGGVFDAEAEFIGPALRLAARSSGGALAGVALTPSSDRWSLSLDGETWGGWGAALSLGAVGGTNVVFYARARGTTGDAVGLLIDSLAMAADGYAGPNGADLVRRIVPFIEYAQDGGGLWYPRLTFGAEKWEHDPTNHGDLDILETDGASPASYNDIAYSTRSVDGNTTTLTKTLRAGLTISTRYIKHQPGAYKVEHELTSDVARRVLLTKNVAASEEGYPCSSVSSFRNGGGLNMDAETFQAAALHRSHLLDGNLEPVVILAAGPGYENDWTIYRISHTSDTSWFNTELLQRNASALTLQYGKLKSGSTTDYSVHLAAGVAKTLHYAIGMDWANTQYNLNEAIYSTFCDALNPGSGYSSRKKLMWSSTWQLRRIKRHDPNHVEGKWLWLHASQFYAPWFAFVDSMWEVMGLNDEGTAQATLDTYHALSMDDPAASGGTADVADSMGGAKPNLDLAFELYCQRFLGYTPTAGTLALALAQTNAIVATIGEIFNSQWSSGMRGFEDSFSMLYAGNATLNHWLAQAAGAGAAATRVGTDGGVTPHGGAWQAKLASAAGGYARVRPLRATTPVYPTWAAGGTHALKSTNGALAFCRPTVANAYYYECTAITTGVSGGSEPTWPTTPGNTVTDGGVTWTCRTRQITATLWINIPIAFASGGARFHVFETDADGVATADHSSSGTLSTSGWQQITYTFVPNAATRYLQVAPEATEAGTAYVDDISVRFVAPQYPGLFHALAADLDAMLMNALDVVAAQPAGAWLTLECSKVLLGDDWTETHEAALVAVKESFPAPFWSDANANKIRFSLWHPIRREWLGMTGWSWPQVGLYITTSRKMLTDAQMAAIYAALPATAIGSPYGDHAFFEEIKLDGTYTEESEWVGDTQGHYQNGGSWLLIDAFVHLAAQWAGVPGAEERLERRLLIETYRDYASHEWLDTADDYGYIGSCPTDNKAYGWNSFVLARGLPIVEVGELPAVGEITGVDGMLWAETGALSAAGALTSSEIASLVDAGSLAAVGSATGIDSVPAVETGALSGAGAVALSAEVATFADLGALAAIGALSASQVAALVDTGSLGAVAAPTGEDSVGGEPQTYTETGALGGLGILSASELAALIEAGTFPPLASISGVDEFTWGNFEETGSLPGLGEQTADPDVLAAADVGELLGLGPITATEPAIRSPLLSSGPSTWGLASGTSAWGLRSGPNTWGLGGKA